MTRFLFGAAVVVFIVCAWLFWFDQACTARGGLAVFGYAWWFGVEVHPPQCYLNP